MFGSGRSRFGGVIMLVVGVVFGGMGVVERYNFQRLESHGKAVTGRILKMRNERSGRSGRTYKISAQFRAWEISQTIDREFKVPKEVYDRYQEGATIGLRYLPDDPTVADVPEARSNGNTSMLIGGIMAAVGLVTCALIFGRGGSSY
jgi:hypothetical protein